MKRNWKKINGATLFLTGVFLIAAGVFFLCNSHTAFQYIIWTISAIFAISGFIQFIISLVRKTKGGVLKAVIMLIAGGAIYLLTPIFVTLPSLFIGVYCLILAVIRLVSYILNTRNKVPGSIINLIGAVFFAAIGVSLMMHPVLAKGHVAWAVGVFLILYGVTYLADCFAETSDRKKTSKGKRRFRVTLPVFMVMLMPSKVWTKINEKMKQSDEDADLVTEIDKTDDEPDLEICIHVGQRGMKKFGHVDIIYQGIAMSYGNYDETTHVLGGCIAEGVFTESERDKYLEFCTTYNKRTIFVYGIKLSEEQKRGVELQLDKMKRMMVSWTPGNEKKNPYANHLMKVAKTKFYKFTKGSFKTYFVVNTNCVKFADTVIGPSGIDILTMTGMITPGTYYDYFENQFRREKSNVITKKFYPYQQLKR